MTAAVVGDIEAAHVAAQSNPVAHRGEGVIDEAGAGCRLLANLLPIFAFHGAQQALRAVVCDGPAVPRIKEAKLTDRLFVATGIDRKSTRLNSSHVSEFRMSS